MRKFIIEDKRYIAPFNEPARELRILNKPLWLAQRDALTPYCETEATIDAPESMSSDVQEALVYRDNLYFDQPFIDEFIRLAKATGTACRAACAADDKAFTTYAKLLAQGFEPGRSPDNKPIYLFDLWYFPRGYTANVVPIVVPSGWWEVGYYSVPSYMRSAET